MSKGQGLTATRLPKQGQGLPITTVVLIILAVAVLAVIIIFFLSGMGSSNSSINTFQCQQMCATINTLIQAKSVCSTKSADLLSISTIKSFCGGGCDKKATCALPSINNGCGYDRSSCTKTELTCDSNHNPGLSPAIGSC